jgi:2-C-methyl-D-erythritol 4-phosphate cytidylyltransferase
MLNATIIVGAGRGHRLGGETPKQYIPIGGTCALRRVVDTFLSVRDVGPVRVVIHPDDEPLYRDAVRGIGDGRLLPPVPGGSTRAHSVRLGLESLGDLPPERVLIHDAARPFVSPEVIAAVLGALDEADGAFAALPIVDALWRTDDGHARSPVSREGLWRAQTPQGFRFGRILQAHRAYRGEAADDVVVARDAGLSVRVVEGSERNFKITSAADLERARQELRPGSCRPLRLEIEATAEAG